MLIQYFYFSFDIDKQTGCVSVNDSYLDRELKSTYQLLVTAKDQGNSSDTIQLTVNIADCNDMTPQLTRIDISTDIEEGQMYFTPELQIRVSFL